MGQLMQQQGGRIQSINRAVQLLEAAASSPDGAGATTLAEAVGLKVSTAHTLIRTLADNGLLELVPETRRYRIGLRLLTLSMAANSNALQRVGLLAGEQVVSLASSLNEFAGLFTLSAGQMLVLSSYAPPNGLTVTLPPGGYIRQPHRMAAGKMLLAASNPELAAAYLEALAATDRDGAATLQAELELARRTGYAEAVNTDASGLHALAIPVPRIGGLQLALAISVPLPRMDRTRMLAAMRQTAVRLATQISK